MNKITEKHREVAEKLFMANYVDGANGPTENPDSEEAMAQILADAFPEPITVSMEDYELSKLPKLDHKGNVTYLPTSLDPKERIRELEKNLEESKLGYLRLEQLYFDKLDQSSRISELETKIKEKDRLMKRFQKVAFQHRFDKKVGRLLTQYEAQKGKA